MRPRKLVKMPKILKACKVFWNSGSYCRTDSESFDVRQRLANSPKVDLNVSLLARIKREAKRQRVWFRLSRVERAIFDLTVRYVKQPRSPRLIDALARIIVKIKAFLASPLRWFIGQIGKPLARKLSRIAESWGNKEAGKWAEDESFIRFLTITDRAFQSLA